MIYQPVAAGDTEITHYALRITHYALHSAHYALKKG